MDIKLEDNGTDGRYVHTFDDGTEAQLIFQRDGALMVISHVGVPVDHRNGGHAAKLVARAANDAKENLFKIQPVCGYAAAQFRRNPEWSDILK